jgi:hypothetical protein
MRGKTGREATDIKRAREKVKEKERATEVTESKRVGERGKERI